MKFVIKGGQPLEGQIEVLGSKNAALKILAACLLTNETCFISNVPNISDINVMVNIIKDLGGKVEVDGHRITLKAELTHNHPSDRLVNLLRASVVVVGPLLARFGEVEITQPGGCLIGARPIDTHLDAFRQLGVEIRQKNGRFVFQVNKLKGGPVILKEMSVTATENVMMLATLAEGESEIRVAAAEPEIEDLANFLNKMGAKITGAGTHIIKIKGVRKLKGTEYKVMPDRIEGGTLIVAAVATKSQVKVKNVIPQHLDSLLHKLKEINANIIIKPNSVEIKPHTYLNATYIDTRPYPGFPTDLQSPMAVLLTQAKGTSQIFETLFESRFNYVKELVKMGANISVLDPHTIVIHGPTPLCGKEIVTHDLRAGASLVIAALIAQGKSVIEDVELIDRGYEKLDQRFKNIGANIERVK